jgi:hypothetical protein
VAKTKYKANPNTILMWTNRTRCAMCKHKESEGHVLEGKQFTPSSRWLFHYYDTHGLDPEMVSRWIFDSVYGLLREKWGFLLNGRP